jgi:hypothetical protein
MSKIDIIKCIQEQVDKIVKEKYKNDSCPPIFTVSVLYKEDDNLQTKVQRDKDHKIILTIQHCGSAFSKVIFPQTYNVYGYEPLEEIMKHMYNRTM